MGFEDLRFLISWNDVGAIIKVIPVIIGWHRLSLQKFFLLYIYICILELQDAFLIIFVIQKIYVF